MKTAMLAIAAFLAVAAGSDPARALSKLDRMLIEELSCSSPPAATRILQELVALGRIDPSKNIGYDSLSCWKIDGGLQIRGMNFTSICAFEESEGTRAMYPDLYYRGPGTSPGQTLSLGTDAGADDLSDWYLALFGPKHVDSAIADGEWTTLGEASEVSCTSWMH